MSFQLDLNVARKRLEIENQLVENINSDLLICLNDINWIRTNCLLANSNLINNSNEFVNGVFDCANELYKCFTFFYLKRKDFMGINLTGLAGEKIETGLSFKTSMIKSNFDQIKKNYTKLSNQILADLADLKVDNFNCYKIFTKNYNLNVDYVIILCDIQEKKYWLYSIV